MTCGCGCGVVLGRVCDKGEHKHIHESSILKFVQRHLQLEGLRHRRKQNPHESSICKSVQKHLQLPFSCVIISELVEILIVSFVNIYQRWFSWQPCRIFAPCSSHLCSADLLFFPIGWVRCIPVALAFIGDLDSSCAVRMTTLARWPHRCSISRRVCSVLPNHAPPYPTTPQSSSSVWKMVSLSLEIPISIQNHMLLWFEPIEALGWLNRHALDFWYLMQSHKHVLRSRVSWFSNVCLALGGGSILFETKWIWCSQFSVSSW